VSDGLLQVRGGIAELDAAWTAWVERIPQEERETIANLVAGADLSTLNGIGRFSQAIMADIFRGTLSPVVAAAAKPWLDTLIFCIQQQHQAANSNGAAVDVLAIIGEIKQKAIPLKQVYTVREIAEKPEDDIIDVSELLEKEAAG
jgi:hypothetical protein